MSASLLLAAALAGTLRVDGAGPFGILSPWQWDTDQCRGVMRTSTGTLNCSGSPGTPVLCDSYLRLDGRLYRMRGTSDWFDGGLIVVNVDSAVGNCRRTNGQALPPTVYPTLVLGTAVINLQNASVHGVPMSHGWEFQMTSTTGDVICDGATTPLPALLKDGFEDPQVAAVFYPDLGAWVR